MNIKTTQNTIPSGNRHTPCNERKAKEKRTVNEFLPFFHFCASIFQFFTFLLFVFTYHFYSLCSKIFFNLCLNKNDCYICFHIKTG